MVTVEPRPLRSAGQTSDASLFDEPSPVTVGFRNGTLYINSPAAEQIEVYTLSGKLLDKASKPEGAITFTISRPEGILIVRGSSGWVRKI